MNEKKYKSLCDICDQLLRAGDSSFERVAIPWLHVIRPHPMFMRNYLEIFKLKPSTYLMLKFRNLACAFRNLWMALFSDGQPWCNVGDSPTKSDLLIISHLLNESFPQQEHDFYYGTIAEESIGHGFNVTIALINHTNNSPSKLAKNWCKSNVSRVILNSALSLRCELKLYLRTYVSARNLNIDSKDRPSELESLVRARARTESFSGGAIFALRIGEQIKALTQLLQPRAIMVTYEGHSWERIAFAAARTISPQICCVGYQHASLFNLQHAIKRKLSAQYNPDVILTSGSIARRKLEKSLELGNVSIKTLGSNRCLLRSSVRRRGAIERAITCLVLPDGDLRECSLLFGFSLECAQAIPQSQFVWRLHPNMSFKTLIKGNPAFAVLPSNVILSKQTLADDIARSDVALYRGSTAIVQAIVSGVEPIYLHQKNEISIDALYEIPQFRAEVLVPEDFKRLVINMDFPAGGIDKMQDYCEQLFTPLNIKSLLSCLSEVKHEEPTGFIRRN